MRSFGVNILSAMAQINVHGCRLPPLHDDVVAFAATTITTTTSVIIVSLFIRL